MNGRAVRDFTAVHTRPRRVREAPLQRSGPGSAAQEVHAVSAGMNRNTQ